MEQVFEICKCAEDDKVKFAMCTFEGRALTWWNGNVQTLGLANANQIPWSNVKAMMTTEYCPATEIQRMEQELWTLTLKGDDIEAYNNRFHELALMCHELVPTEKKKIEWLFRGVSDRIKGNIHFLSSLATLPAAQFQYGPTLQGQVYERGKRRMDGARGRAYVVVGKPAAESECGLGLMMEKLDDIRVVRDFPEVFPDDLLGLPLVREIEFRI
ncbi:putative reverse transcriptase domain-containing protein [Tanacetum coccineum]